MVCEKFFYERLQLSEVCGCRKQNLLFRREMNCNFTLKLLLDLSLPRFKIDFACPNRTIKLDAEREGMLMLTGNRDQVFIAQHTGIINDAGKLCASAARTVDARLH